jgi:aspartyl-tRNA(Asn)/glutamyl-tRNA(Gln) amidotransferase subunit A
VNRRALLASAAAAAGIPRGLRAQISARGKKMAQSSARDRLEACLERISDPRGEGARTCLKIYAAEARAAADAADVRARSGHSLGPLDGTVVAIKDLFDVGGETTRAGSTVLRDAPPAMADAPVVRRLRTAGAAIVAKTNMSEFAFTAFGINPHFGTPGNPAGRMRVPGGSSSGSAVAAADGMCEIGIGSDTGGSCRIPAALCGIVGYKPSKFRVPTEGAFPLSYTLDSIGPLARSVADCAAADAVLAGEASWVLEPVSLNGLRLGIPQGLPLRDLDSTVQARFSAASAALARAGVHLSDEAMPILDEPARVQAKGSFSSVESYAIHRRLLAKHADDYDPMVRSRIEAGRDVSAADYIDMLRRRAELVRAMDDRLSGLDALVMPTVPIVAPEIAEVSKGDASRDKNLLLLRNPALANFFDLCAISIPLPREGALPVGLMLVARNGQDHKLFRMAAAVERLFA